MHPRLKPLLLGAAFAFSIVVYDWLDGGVEAWRPAPEPVAVQGQPACLKVDIEGNVIGECSPGPSKCRMKADLAGNIIEKSPGCP